MLPIKQVRDTAAAFIKTDLTRLRIEREGEVVEFRRSLSVSAPPQPPPSLPGVAANGSSRAAETIKADLVGIFHLSRPAPKAGEVLEGDRELAYVEALGIRNPVRSRGKGRIAAMLCQEGAAVEYGQPLFEIERS